jgi:hypothetical protein
MIATRLLFLPWLTMALFTGGAFWALVGGTIVMFDIAHKRAWSPWKFGFFLLLALLTVPDLFAFLGALNGR